MISPPDFKEKQILFFNAQEIQHCHLSVRNENLLIQNEEKKTIGKVPVSKLAAVFIAGDFTVTTKLIDKINRVGASLFFLSRNLQVRAVVGAYAEGNYLLRQKQYSLSPEKALRISRRIVLNKMRNSLNLLRGAGIIKIAKKSRAVYRREMREKIKNAPDLASLRGLEGIVSKDYFQTYFSQIDWYRRVPRAKIDENNILLDIGYTFLFNFVDAILRVYGFDTYKGIYHQLYFNRKSLATDMMEPFRCVVDKALVKMHTLKQFDKKDFGYKQGRYYLSYKNSGKYAKIFLEEILRYKMDIYHYIRDHYYWILNDNDDVKDFVIR